MGNNNSLEKYADQQKYVVDGNTVEWNVFKKICKSRCEDSNKRVRNLGSWAFGGNPNNQIDANNNKLNEYLLLCKPQSRKEYVTFEVPKFTSLGIMGISF